MKALYLALIAFVVGCSAEPPARHKLTEEMIEHGTGHDWLLMSEGDRGVLCTYWALTFGDLVEADMNTAKQVAEVHRYTKGLNAFYDAAREPGCNHLLDQTIKSVVPVASVAIPKPK